ncbi:polysaccharide biosynthesis protein CapD [Desulfatibacillum aliphaticivorans]|uniref:Polysaccharide biosynthesis protein CapD n=1 Tax=Desulfatibacillum aliphaticivorans TaxID=218208 RepID=B8FAQ9_DESAL|nr:polysaccharide biosynthesis protein [Desulfatibacillum aliphaticivorans]ACL03355.1 polysaccharide biosynthesis protein CapD [Desulfatibacillum aliphaticivorans]
MESFLKGKRVLVTGACGTVGSELVRQLLEEHQVEELIGLDNNESELFFLEQRFQKNANGRFFLADVRDEHKLARKMRGVHAVFHAAAFKHVILCEKSPFEAVRTNIMGVQNIITAAADNKVERVIFTSSDKAVNPTNVMGTSKLMGERLMTAADSNSRDGGPIYASTRFGNVLGSRGSVIPIFREQIRKGGPVTLTDPGMTRFIMSLPQAVQLVIDSASLACGGEVFVTKMPSIKISDLAQVMIDELAEEFGRDPKSIEIENIGIKPGEKMYEELMSHEETRRVWELPKYFAVLPAFTSLYREVTYDYPQVAGKTVDNPYNSGIEENMSREALAAFLKENNLLFEGDKGKEHPSQRYFP